jgi:hypothetical protein
MMPGGVTPYFRSGAFTISEIPVGSRLWNIEGLGL